MALHNFSRRARVALARYLLIIATCFGFALNAHGKLNRVSDLYRCAAKNLGGQVGGAHRRAYVV
jgi:hypothetical protein